MKREKYIEVIEAALAGEKGKAAYLLERINDPDVLCFIQSPDGTFRCNEKTLTPEQLDHELAMAKKYGVECVEVDFAEAM